MKCFTSYQRLTADTISGETLIVSTRYTTFDKQEMDTFEESIKLAIRALEELKEKNTK